MRKGDIVLIAFPFTDLSGQKVRPALVLHAPNRGNDCIVAFISSMTSKSRSAFSVPLQPNATNGLKAMSTLKLDKLATLEQKLVLGELGTLDRTHQSLVDTKVRTLFGL